MQESIFCKKPVIDLPKNAKRRKPILRKLLFCLIFLLIQTCPKTYGQKISLALKNARLEQVFEAIGKQSGNIIWYSNEAVAEEKRITIFIDNVPVEEALTAVLSSQPLYFVKNGSFFVIRSNENNQHVSQTGISENAKHRSFLLQLLITVVVSLVANFFMNSLKRLFSKKTKVEKHRNHRVYTNAKNEHLKLRPEVFNALISVAKAENISGETRKKIIDLLVYDYREVSPSGKAGTAKSKSMAAEAEAALEAAIKAHHAYELTETMGDGL